MYVYIYILLIESQLIRLTNDYYHRYDSAAASSPPEHSSLGAGRTG